jgi:hypothetical protein
LTHTQKNTSSHKVCNNAHTFFLFDFSSAADRHFCLRRFPWVFNFHTFFKCIIPTTLLRACNCFFCLLVRWKKSTFFSSLSLSYIYNL